jgi:outer membrane lipoprotein-sorting protein
MGCFNKKMSFSMRRISRFGIIALATTVMMGVSIAPRFPAISQPAPPSATPIRSDLLLLFQAAEKALNVSTFQTESSTEINYGSRGTSTKIQFQTKTIVQAPNRFRAEVKLGNQTNPIFTFVSDGQMVSLYRADRNQYTTMSYEQFNRRNDTFLIGMFATLYMTVYPNMKDANAQGGFSNAAVQQQLSSMLPANVKGKPERTNNENLIVYEYADQQQGINYGMAVTPIDALIKRVQLTATTKAYNLTMTETIQRRVDSPKIPPITFRFTPPQGAKRVKAIDTSPTPR